MKVAIRRILVILQGGLVTFGLTLSASAFGQQTIAISGTDTGRTYEGIGAVSGGGATSVLLRDYVEPQRTQILDYLFKPSFGAAMQELYVEIGGDGNSTEGSELSHMHTATDLNYYRGYEWWLMEQAKSRNPAILLDATAWSAPNWVGNDNYWSTNATNDAAGYLAKWILGAKSAHGLDINYIGCKNEPNFYSGAAWPELLRTTLNSNGLTTVGIHGLDDPSNGNPPASTMWTWANAMSTDATLSSTFYAISAHGTAPATGGNAPPASLIALNKPLWDTEEHPFNAGFTRATDIVTAFNSNYISGKVTKTIYWFLITAFYQSEPDYDLASAMVTASPWSGNYTVEPGLWGYAHVGQFTQAGWKFLDNACGNFTNGGNYVTLASTNGTDYSVIAQTTKATATQNITFNVSGGLSTGPVSVWTSNATTQFQQQASVTPANGSFTVSMAPNTIYSITTTTGQQKGAYTPPAAAAFPFPYYENYDHYTDFTATGYRAYYHADIGGGFELYKRADGTGNCLRQVVSPKAQSWAPEWNPYTIVGNTTWTNYQVSADVFFETTTGWAGVMGRVNSTGDGYGTTPNGYYMTLTPTGAWTFNKVSFGGGATAISTGQATLAAGDWHNIQLVFQGTSIKGLVDATQVFSVTDATYGTGSVGLVTLAGTTAQFDNLIVNTVGGATPSPTVFVQDGENGDAGAPLDAGGSSGSTSSSASSSSGGKSSSSSSSGGKSSSSSSSGATSSGAASSGTASSGATSSGATSSGVASSGASSGNASSTGAPSSGTTSIGGTSSGTAASGGGSASTTSGGPVGSGGSASVSSASGTVASSGSPTSGAGGVSGVGTSGVPTGTAGSTATGSESSSGCSCRESGTAGGGGTSGGILVASALLLAGSRRRKGSGWGRALRALR
jgi:galactosylceramidase